jgi:hypothetical protein
LRCEGRVRFMVQVLSRNQVLSAYEYRRPVRWLLQWQERLLCPVLLRRLLQVPEQGPHKGQALAQLSGRRSRSRSD